MAADELTFRWGILGAGYVARKFVLGLRHAEIPATAAVVASRSSANAERFARELSIPSVAASYEEAVEAEGIDAYYVATPPREHRPLALLCLRAGKPVLVEKPLAMDAAAAEEIVDAARSNSVFCMEGMWTRFLPLVRELKQFVDGGGIGEIRAVTGSFGSATAPSVNRNLFDKDLGGGALLHRGVYPLSMACHLLGSPVDVTSRATLGETGVDEDSTVVARHVNGGITTAYSSLRTQPANDCSILGTTGTVHLQAPIYRPSRMTVARVLAARAGGSRGMRWERLREGALLQEAHQRAGRLPGLARRGGSRTVTRYYGGNGYHYEADEVARAVRAGALESDVMPLGESVEIARAMTSARAQWT